jgi:micrococcal nuclease
MIAGKSLVVTGDYHDRQKRFIGFVNAGDVDVNKLMVADGHAWDFPRYSNGQYSKAQKEAKKIKRGLWADEKPVAPWTWRAK